MIQRSFVFILFSVALVTFASAYGAKTCSSAVATFNHEWSVELPALPTLKGISKGLKRDLLRDPQLSQPVRNYLKTPNSDPLKMGNAALLNGLHAALAERVRSEIKDPKVAKNLLDSLGRAIDELKLESPPFDGNIPIDDGNGGSGGGGTGPNPGEPGDDFSAKTDDEFRLQVEKIVHQTAIKNCVVRTTILFFVSNIINTIGALEVKWERYAGKDAPVSAVLNKETWDRAAEDPLFRHNVAWNAILMLSLGGFSCMKDQKLGTRLITAMTFVSSITGQYLSNGHVELDQLLVDVFFVRFISLNKTRLAFYLSDTYKRTGYAGTRLLEGSLQLLSEGAGAYLYPRAVQVSDFIWGKKRHESAAR